MAPERKGEGGGSGKKPPDTEGVGDEGAVLLTEVAAAPPLVAPPKIEPIDATETLLAGAPSMRVTGALLVAPVRGSDAGEVRSCEG